MIRINSSIKRTMAHSTRLTERCQFVDWSHGLGLSSEHFSNEILLNDSWIEKKKKVFHLLVKNNYVMMRNRNLYSDNPPRSRFIISIRIVWFHFFCCFTFSLLHPPPPKRQSFSFPPPPSNPHLYEYFVQCHDKFTFNWVNCTSSSMSGHRYSIKSVIANKLNKYCPRKKLHLQSQLLTGGGTLKMVLYKQ